MESSLKSEYKNFFTGWCAARCRLRRRRRRFFRLSVVGAAVVDFRFILCLAVFNFCFYIICRCSIGWLTGSSLALCGQLLLRAHTAHVPLIWSCFVWFDSLLLLWLFRVRLSNKRTTHNDNNNNNEAEREREGQNLKRIVVGRVIGTLFNNS